MERLKERVAHIGQYAVTLLKWMVLGGVIGLVGGIIGSLFHIGVDTATQARLAHPWVLYLMPVGGLAIVGLYRLTKTEGKGTNDIIASVHFGGAGAGAAGAGDLRVHGHHPPVAAAAGREGAALQIGGGIGYQAGRLLRLGEKDLPLATLCGMSGVFAAPVRHTPDGHGVCTGGHQRGRSVLCRTGTVPDGGLDGLSGVGAHGVPPTRFTVTVPGLEVRTMLLVMVLALLCAVVSILFCRGLHGVEHLLKRTLKNPYLRVAVGAAVLIGLTLLTNGDYNGAGMEVIGRAIAGQADPWAWVWKLLFTAITIGCGFKGGEVVPSFFVGAAFGCVAAGWLGLPAGFGAAMGLVSVFCGAVNCPLASIILSVELFGSGDLLYFAMACSISYLISGYCGLYSSQTILYSKLRAEFINVRTHE